MNKDPNDKSDNPYRPKTLEVRDVHHDSQLYRDVDIANAQTVVQFGALPPGGLPVVPKRKPNLLSSTVSAAPARKQEDDSMKLHQVAATAMVPLAIAAGCSMAHGDPNNPKKNPHPAKRYEVTATADAPGPWDSVKGYLEYQVINSECTPEDKFLGVHAMPRLVGHDFEMTRVDDKTWKGYFYQDFILDEDYYGLGVCHWNVASVSANFTVHGRAFGSGDIFQALLNNASQVSYFKKSDFLDRSPNPYGALDFSASNPDYVKNPGAFFPITVSVKEVTP